MCGLSWHVTCVGYEYRGRTSRRDYRRLICLSEALFESTLFLLSSLSPLGRLLSLSITRCDTASIGASRSMSSSRCGDGSDLLLDVLARLDRRELAVKGEMTSSSSRLDWLRSGCASLVEMGVVAVDKAVQEEALLLDLGFGLALRPVKNRIVKVRH